MVQEGYAVLSDGNAAQPFMTFDIVNQKSSINSGHFCVNAQFFKERALIMCFYIIVVISGNNVYLESR